jgi:hypothetical protein
MSELKRFDKEGIPHRNGFYCLAEDAEARIAELEKLLVTGEVELKGNPLEIISKQQKRIAELQERIMALQTALDKQYTGRNQIQAEGIQEMRASIPAHFKEDCFGNTATIFFVADIDEYVNKLDGNNGN